MTRLSALAAVLFVAGLGTAHAAAPIVCPDMEAAQNGSPVDEFYLGKAYDEGYCGLEKDKAAAESWYRVAAKQGHTLAAWELGETFFTGDGVPTNYPEAKTWYLAAAQKGHGPAQLRLGFLYAEAHFEGLTTDMAEAEKWFRKAAEQDAGDSRFRLGNFYAHYKKPPDDPMAFYWLQRAAEGGHRIAMFDLGRMLKDGRPGVPQNAPLAIEWLEKAANEDVLQAQMYLSQMYGAGEGVPKDPMKSMKWTLRIAGAPTASVFWINKAGDIFFEGWEGIARNYPTARKFYERAALKDDAHALGRLGEIHLHGLGVEKDDEKARDYLQRAAARGNTRAAGLLKKNSPSPKGGED